MKRIILLLTLVLILFVAGCNKHTSKIKDNTDISDIEESSTDNPQKDSEDTSDGDSHSSTEDNNDKSTEEGSSNTSDDNNDGTNNQNQSVEIIAKSDNNVTSEEKEKILNELNALLDDVLNNINNMDNVEDSDLSLEE